MSIEDPFNNQKPSKESEAIKSQSELSPDERKRVGAFLPNSALIERAKNILTDACNTIGLPTPDEMVTLEAAKIIGALGEERAPRAIDGGPHKLWLLTEGYINAGRDPYPINEASLSLALGATKELRADSLEAIKGRIAELEAKAIMPMPRKPESTATPEQLTEYRQQLAWRHIKERLGKHHGVYSTGNMDNLYGVMMTIVDSKHPGFGKLYDDVARKLMAGGAHIDRWLTDVNEEMLEDMVNIIAVSDVPIHEETFTEKYLHAQKNSGFHDYIARDLTIEYEIGDLTRRLP